MKLSDGAVASYSKNERRAFAVLPKNGRKLSTVEIAERIYRDAKERPYYVRQVTLGVMDVLVRKVRDNRENFIIHRSERRGPHPIQFWIEERKSA